MQSLNVSQCVADIKKLIRATITEEVTIEYHLAEHLPEFEGDNSQIQQIVMNLLINAHEAMEGQAGQINVSTGFEDHGRYQADDFQHNMPSGKAQVYLEVQDTGKGMDKITISRMFEPFFSTKFTGRGLGMASVLGIIRGHNGAIKVTSTKNQGSKIRVYFPVQG